MNTVPITIVGNLVSDPELRLTPSGSAVANFTIAHTPRTFDKQASEWKDGDAMFLNCSVWRQYAENVTESLQKGARVIVQGNLKSRSYETREGEKRTVFEVDVDEVGPALRYATAKVTRTQAGGGQQRTQQPRQQAQADPWGPPAQATGQADPWAQQSTSDPWGAQPARGSQADPWAQPAVDEPSF